MRVAVVAETFLPEVNGVTNSVRHVVEQLRAGGHEVLIIAPAPGPTRYGDVEVERVTGLTLPFYRSLAVGLARRDQLRLVLGDFDPDVVHLAAPVVLGAIGVQAAADLGVPTVAVFQTDLAAFAERYHLGAAGPGIWRWLRRVHGQADLTLAPSTHAIWQLRRWGIERIGLWSRGVDHERFHPRHRSTACRTRWSAPAGEIVVGYVGRLANEKRVHLLRPVLDLPGTRLVVIGDGPARSSLEVQLRGARFEGFLDGATLGEAVASLDVFVHTGAAETFGQAIQEALASGVPVVAPAAGGPLDLVRHGDNGFLFPPDAPLLLRGAVESLVSDADLRAAMGRRAFESVAGRSWEAATAQLLGHYASVLPAPVPGLRGLSPLRAATTGRRLA